MTDTTGPAGAPARPDLVLVVGNGRMMTHPLAGEIVIGREPGCDLVIDDRALSRRHAILRRDPLSIQDLGSKNGVRLASGLQHGGDPVPLTPGGSFGIGPFSFIVIAGEATDPSSRSSGRERLVVPDPTPTGVSSLVREIARSGINVLIQGETGVGKEVLATTLHALSDRSGPLSSLNCAAFTESLLESELFGHEKGAFTGATATKPGLLEAASGGTVFLDEIGEMPLAIQAKLLRAVEAREVRRLGSTRPIAIGVRIVAATNRHLPAEVAARRFREDLYFRLDGVTLRIPPLRERRALIGTLALRFIEDARARFGKPDLTATPELLHALAAHEWPGNVRELKAVIDRAALLARGRELGVRHLAFSERPSDPDELSPAPSAPAPAPAPSLAPADALDFLDAEQRAERERILAALDECAGNQTRAAKRLGMSRTALVTKLALYRIPRPRT